MTIVLAMNLVDFADFGTGITSGIAMRVYKTFWSYCRSVVLSVICAVIGILLSILAGTPVGSTIVATDIVAFMLVVP